MIEQVLIRNLEQPFEKSVQADINWFCESFGFYETIDKNKTTAAIFKRILENTRDEKGVTTKELGDELELSRVSTLNQVKKLIAGGLVIQDGMQYRLRSPNLFRTLREMKKDINRIFEDVEDVVKEIDAGLGLKRRHIPKKTEEYHFI